MSRRSILRLPAVIRVRRHVGPLPRQLGPLLALPAGIGAAVYFFGIPLWPDDDYYVGGVSLFPAPLGTLIGTAVGYSGLPVVNAAASFAIILLVGLIARELGGQPLAAQALALVIARGEWFKSWGMDSTAVALLLTAALLNFRGRSRWAIAFVCLGAATHLAALPLALGALAVSAYRRRLVWVAAFGLAAFGTAIAFLTGYRVGFRLLYEPHAFVTGAHEVLLACWPLLLLACVARFHSQAILLFIGSALGAILAGAIPASVDQVGITRYSVPCIFIAVAGMSLRTSRDRARIGLPRHAGRKATLDRSRAPSRQLPLGACRRLPLDSG